MALSKTYEVGDTVWVAYPFPSLNYFAPVSRVILKIDVTDSGNVALVSFTVGPPVLDTDAAQTIYASQLLAAIAIVDDVISLSAAAVVLDTTTLSEESVVGQASPTLGRVD